MGTFKITKKAKEQIAKSSLSKFTHEEQKELERISKEIQASLLKVNPDV